MKILINILFILFVATSYSQELNWITIIGGEGFDCINDIVEDEHGDLIVTGYFQESMEMNGFKLSAKGDTDIFLAKFDKNGELKWITQAGSDFYKSLNITEQGIALDIDKLNNIYVIGYFKDKASFGRKTLKSKGGDDIFIAKYNPKGKPIWVKSIGSSRQDRANSVVVYDNKVFIAGTSKNNFFIGKSKINSEGHKPFVACLDLDGNYDWVRTINSNSSCKTIDVLANKESVYLCGNYQKELSFQDTKIESQGGTDFFILELDKNGNYKWLQSYGGPNNDLINKAYLNKENQIFLTGEYDKTTQIGNKKLYSQGQEDVLIMKVDANKEVSFAKSFGGPKQDKLKSVGYNAANDMINFFGTFEDTIYNKTDTIVDLNESDRFVAETHKNGMITDFLNCELSNINGQANLIVKDDYIILSGSFRKIFKFNDEEIYSNGYNDGFIAQISKSEILLSEEELLKESITVYPNPVNDVLYYTSNMDIESIELYDESGRLLYSYTKPKGSISLSHFKSGNYIVKIKTKNNTSVHSVIKL